jgi:hypothetical protein
MSNILFELASKIPVLRNIQQMYGELSALRQLYDPNNTKGGLVPGKYYQQVDPANGNIKGMSCVCLCGNEYRMLSMFECFRQGYKCSQCRMDLNVLRFVGAVDASGKFLVKAQELEGLLRKLPVRPVGISDVKPSVQPIGDWGSDPTVSAAGWDGAGAMSAREHTQQANIANGLF